MRWFPFSSFYVPPFALYLSDHTLAVLRLDNKNSIRSFASAELPQGLINDGVVLDREKVAAAIRTLCAEAKPEPILLDGEVPVVFAIPESQSFTHVFTIPANVHPDKLKELVANKAKTLIPMEMSELYWDWHVVEEQIGGTARVLFAAAPRKIIDATILLCEACNLLPLAIDMETVSLARALLSPDSHESVIMDIGARTTTLGFFDAKQRLALSISIPIAGDAFSRSLVERMHISFEDAEDLKKKQGMDRMIPENRTLIILQERLQAMLVEYGKARTYFESTYKKPLTRVILAGKSALMPGLSVYFGMNMTTEVLMGDPRSLLCGNEKVFPSAALALPFAPLIGLALRANHSNPETNGINLLHGWEGERWGAREHRILTRWKKLALPLCAASVVLLAYVLLAYIYLPLERLSTENLSRVTLIPEYAPSGASSSTNLFATTTNDSSVSASLPPQEEESMIVSTSSAQTVHIRRTPTGWLNVREGPGQTFPVMTKIHPGETYVLIEEKGSWMRLRLETGNEGWISAEYGEKL